VLLLLPPRPLPADSLLNFGGNQKTEHNKSHKSHPQFSRMATMASSPHKDIIMALVGQCTAHFGWLDGKIDLQDDDLSAFLSPDASFMIHAPLWGTKVGQEKETPVAEARKTLAGLMKWVSLERHHMQMAVHDKQLCTFLVVKLKVLSRHDDTLRLYCDDRRHSRGAPHLATSRVAGVVS
jgi:hypothetical protein